MREAGEMSVAAPLPGDYAVFFYVLPAPPAGFDLLAVTRVASSG